MNAAMTRAFRAREARFRRTRDCKRCGTRCARVYGKTKKKKAKNAKGERKVAPRARKRPGSGDEGAEGEGPSGGVGITRV